MLGINIDNAYDAKIKVVGIGGGGGNAVNRMIDENIDSIKYIAVNTDSQALSVSKADIRIQIGDRLTRGLGAGADPEIGRKSAEHSKNEIFRALKDTDLLFIAAGMGGGTGTGAAPVVAEIAAEMGILTVAVVTKPFSFEQKKRMTQAIAGIERLTERVDSIVTISNDKLFEILDKKVAYVDALKYADDVLRQGIQGVSDLITKKGLINLDYADLKTIISGGGVAHMGVGYGTGPDRAKDAVNSAINSPLLDTRIDGARAVIVNISGDETLGLHEINDAISIINALIDEDVRMIFGAVRDDELAGSIKVTIIAAGFNDRSSQAVKVNGDIAASSVHETNEVIAGERSDSIKTGVNRVQELHEKSNDYDKDDSDIEYTFDDMEIPDFIKQR